MTESMNLTDYLDRVLTPAQRADAALPPTANEPSDGERLYRFNFGAYGSTVLDVFADELESAFEIAVEWLDDNAPGHLVKLEESDYIEAAKELHLAWDPENYDTLDMLKIIERAEADLTSIGHTTLKNGQFGASYEWTVVKLQAFK